MAYSTYTAFIAALHSMAVTGVTRSYAYPPEQINTADMPIKFIRINTAGESLAVMDGTFELQNGVADVVVIVEPEDQNDRSTIYTSVQSAIDNLITALQTNSLALGVDAVSIEANLELFGDTNYWTVTATVEASG